MVCTHSMKEQQVLSTEPEQNTPKENEMKVALDSITKHTQKKLRIRQIGNWASLNDIQPGPADRSGAILQLYSSREPIQTEHFISKRDSPDKINTDGDQSLHRTTERLSWVNASRDIVWSTTTSTHINIRQLHVHDVIITESVVTPAYSNY